MSNGTTDTTTPALTEHSLSVAPWKFALIPVVLALVMAAPSLRGGFLTGDDIHLVRDHVLVNHPSINHMVKLFCVPHRDLYQPIPLATFAVNFAVIKWLGLTPTVEGLRAGAWVFHLTNILIHALNALLVWWLVRKVSGRGSIALVAGSLFAVHPLNVECVAWLNGRMMMLSTTFTLGALIAANRMIDRPNPNHLALTVLMVVLAMMSKVCVGLPVLLLLVPFVRRRWPRRWWWAMFAFALAVTGLFVFINFQLSRGQIDTAGEVLRGPRLARTVIALGWYVSRYFVPVGLAPWHPTEKLVTFVHPRFVPAALAVAGLLAVSILLLWRSFRSITVASQSLCDGKGAARLNAAGVVWFFATIAVTLPLVLARNLMVAERYAYLPTIGFHWIIAAGGVYAFTVLRRRGGLGVARRVATVCAIVVLVPLLVISWRTAGDYRDNVIRCRRTAELYPDHESVWTRLAWAHYDAGEYEQAIETAGVELERHPHNARSDVWQVQGLALLRSGAIEEALTKLNAAVEIDPDGGTAQVRLATALAESGRLDNAVRHYRQAVETMPSYNPGIIGLAKTYRKLNRPNEAAEMFEKALVNNPYDPIAASELAEIELADGRTQAAATRLEKLLSWMPENAAARANLGLCYLRLGRTEDAISAYRDALAYDPKLVPPRVNLATLLAQAGEPEQADNHFRQAAEHDEYADPVVLLCYSDFLVAQADLRAAAALWTRGLERQPNNQTMISWYAWVCVLAERWDPAEQARANIVNGETKPLAATLVDVMLDVHAERSEDAVAAMAKLCTDESADAREARDRLQLALKAYSQRHASNPWPYYLMVMMLEADGRTDDARSALEAFERVCTDPDWIRRARSLLAAPSSS